MRSLKIALLCLMAVVFLQLPSLLLAKPYRSLKDGINVRFDSTTFSETIDKLSKNEVVEVINEKHKWYHIRLPSRINCWVGADFIEDLGQNKAKIKATSLNIRSKPSLEKGIIIGSLKKGKVISVKSKTESWAKISCYPYAKGWVHSNLLEPIKEEEKIKYLLKNKFNKLDHYTSEEKKEIKEEIIQKGKKVIPLLDKQLNQLNEPAVYKSIIILSRIGKKNPDLIPYFFNKINLNFLPKTTVYLDVLQNIVIPDEPKIPFYRLTQESGISREAVQSAYNYLKTKYEKQ